MWSSLRKLLTAYFVATGIAAHLAAIGLVVLVVAMGGTEIRQMLASRGGSARQWVADYTARFERVGADPDFTDLVELPRRFAFRDYHGEVGAGRGYGVVRAMGADKPYKTLDAAVRAANAGDIIEIDPGTYELNSAVITKNDIVVRGRGGIASFDAIRGSLVEDKAILVIRGGNVLIENIEFANAESRGGNGGGIRAEGTKLLVRNCYFHDNQNGILTIAHLKAELVVEDSEFARNGWVDGQAHQIYVGRLDRFVLRRTYLHGTQIGSAVKSRAEFNLIEYNFIADGLKGAGNYNVDLTDGGRAIVIGNVMEKAKDAQNGTFVSYAAEAMSWRENALYIAHNTLVNDRHDGNFINNHSKVLAHALNNVLVGRATPSVGGPVQFVGNVVMGNSRLRDAADDDLGGADGSGRNRIAKQVSLFDRSALDYRLTAHSPAIDAGQPLPALSDTDLTPLWEFHVDGGAAPRSRDGKAMDAGAYESAGAPAQAH